LAHNLLPWNFSKIFKVWKLAFRANQNTAYLAFVLNLKISPWPTYQSVFSLPLGTHVLCTLTVLPVIVVVTACCAVVAQCAWHALVCRHGLLQDEAATSCRPPLLPLFHHSLTHTNVDAQHACVHASDAQITTILHPGKSIIQRVRVHVSDAQKVTLSPRHNLHPGKSIIQCNGHHLTHHTPHHILRYSPYRLTQIITKDNIRPIISPITTSQPTTQPSPLPQLTYPSLLLHITYPTSITQHTKAKQSPICHRHLRCKYVSLRTKAIISPLTVQSIP
jgi:hypothetical protein